MIKVDKKALVRFVAVIILVVAADQISKSLILSHLRPGQMVSVIPGFFNLTLHFNPGAAFGMLANFSDGIRQIVIAATTLIALTFVFYLLIREYSKDVLGQVALAMIVGGAVGNITDRIRIGEVVDFLDFYLRQFHWWTFNVADSCICIGVFVLLLRKPKKEAPSAPTRHSNTIADSRPR